MICFSNFVLANMKTRVRVKVAALHWPSGLATLHSPCTSFAPRRESATRCSWPSESNTIKNTRSMAKIIYEVYQNQNEHNAAYGKWYGHHDHKLHGLRTHHILKTQKIPPQHRSAGGFLCDNQSDA